VKKRLLMALLLFCTFFIGDLFAQGRTKTSLLVEGDSLYVYKLADSTGFVTYLLSQKLVIGDTLTSSSTIIIPADVTFTGTVFGIPNDSSWVYIDLIPTATVAHSEGRIFYDSDDDTFKLFNAESDVALNVGEEEWIFARNTSGSTILNGQVVYQTGNVGHIPTMALAQADVVGTSHLLGIATHDIEDNTNGYVTVSGIVRDWDTDGSPVGETWTSGERLYLSATTAGAMTDTKPNGVALVIPVAHVVDPHTSQGSVYAEMGHHIENDDFSDDALDPDKLIGDSIDDDLIDDALLRNAYSSLWFHGSAATATITSQNVYTQVTIFENEGAEDASGNVVGDATTDDDFVISLAGTYEVHIQASLTNDGGGLVEFHLGVEIILNTVKTITDATNATPIVVTSVGHGLKSGDGITQSGVVGNTNANGDFQVTRLTADTYSLQDLAHVDIAGNGAYVSGGTVTSVMPGNIILEAIVSNTQLERGATSGDYFLNVGDILECYAVNQDGTDNLAIEQMMFGVKRIGNGN